MNRTMLAGTLTGVIVATAGGTVAGYKLLESRSAQPAYAEVLAVDPVTRTVEKPREVCRDTVVSRPAPVADEKRITGTAVGAVIGGLIANQAVKGSSRELATAAGAAAGGVAGNQVQKNIQEKRTVTETRRVCETVTDTEQRVVGYDVRYRLGDAVDSVRMRHAPGDTIPVRDGELVLEQHAAQNAGG